MKPFLVITLALLGSMLAPGDADAAILTVPSPPYPTIQSAIDEATDGDVVEVQPGFYLENIDFLGKAITVVGVLGASDTFLQSPNPGSPGSVVSCRSGEGHDSVLEGFHISGGGGTPSSDGSTLLGLGMYNLNSSPEVRDCIFMDLVANGTVYGGGMANIASSPRIIDCVFQECQAERGGAMYNTSGSFPEIFDTLFWTNAVESVVAGVDGAGGALYSELASAPQVDRCIFENNFSFDGEGGAVHGVGQDGVSCGSFVNSLFIFNMAVQGGAIFQGAGQITVTNCTFAENEATVVTDPATCIFSEGATTAANCIFYDNAPSNSPLAGNSDAFDVTWSDVEGGWPGVQNFDLPPNFAFDFSLFPGSPCVDSGNDFADIDVIAAGQQNITGLDLGLNPRFQDDPGAPNVGAGDPPVDRGCFERDGTPGDPFGGTSPDFVRGDADGDGTFNGIVDGVFVLAFGFQGGPPPPCMAAADADGNGVLNALIEGVFVLTHQFGGGPPPPPPYPACGTDGASDLMCEVGPPTCNP